MSTQSLVILAVNAWGHLPRLDAGARVVIAFGAALYFAAFIVIALRCLTSPGGIDLDRDWANTNCIIHGAMKITGLASCVSGVVPVPFVPFMWLWVLGWFAIVETIEVLRMIVRIRTLGVIRAIWICSPTQRARNFTFGMLYAFTMNFHLDGSAAASGIWRVALEPL